MGEFDLEIEDEVACFDNVLSEEPRKLKTKLGRYVYKTEKGKIYKVENTSKEKDVCDLFNVCVSGLSSDWFQELTVRSRRRYVDHVRSIFEWLSESKYKHKKESRYGLLKEFESYRMNILGNKSSPLELINVIIKEGLSATELDDYGLDYLETMLHLSKPTRIFDKKSYTLSSWFDMPWLRKLLGEKQYLRLESPRILHLSFRITIATTLMWLLDKRRRWRESEVVKEPNYKKKNLWAKEWGKPLFE